jgi:D-serine dehydratase
VTNHQDDEELLFKPEDIARIEHIGSRFAPYLKKIQPLYDEYIARQIPSIAHITSLLENYYYFLSFIGDEGILNDSHKSIMGIAAKTTSDVGGIYRLIQTGFPVQARAVLRTLLETAITTKFIYQDYQNRLPLYADFSDFQRYLKSVLQN